LPALERIGAMLLAINAAGGERNPRKTASRCRAQARQERKAVSDSASSETRDHFTTGNAKSYKQPLQELLQTAPRRKM
jgi:homoserine O-acetyltransferase